MATASASLLLLLISIISVNCKMGLASAEEQMKTWCVAKPSTDEVSLRENIAYVCNNVDDCKDIGNGGGCFTPDTLINHASVAMNLYYQSRGRNHWNCDFDESGLIVITDPSYGSCRYA